MVLVAGFSITAAAGQGATQAAARPMTVDDALRLVRLGDVLISPDGTQVFYSASELDWEANKRRTHYFMVPFAGGEARRFIGDQGGHSFRFSPDGGYLSFLREGDDEAQVFGLAMGGRQRRHLLFRRGDTQRRGATRARPWPRSGVRRRGA